MRIISGGRWTVNGRWVVVGEDGTILFDSPGLYGHGYDLRERQVKFDRLGPAINYDDDPDLKGNGEFDSWQAAMNLDECVKFIQGRLAQR